MMVRALDANHDWQFGSGRQSYKQDIEALKQSLSTRLQSWKGDCFFASGEGVDWSSYLDTGTKRLLDIDICKVINTTGGVIAIRDYRSEITPDRRLALNARLSTIYGSINLFEVSNA
ncbi:MAG: hypothetical protein LBQ83_03055 [Candidatus Margulisbacteria bacterium]|jgi:hypothetical protein|nr:hypothetical protein [Candidatus Margulisiibacteriota bacterium]